MSLETDKYYKMAKYLSHMLDRDMQSAMATVQRLKSLGLDTEQAERDAKDRQAAFNFFACAFGIYSRKVEQNKGLFDVGEMLSAAASAYAVKKDKE